MATAFPNPRSDRTLPQVVRLYLFPILLLALLGTGVCAKEMPKEKPKPAPSHSLLHNWHSSVLALFTQRGRASFYGSWHEGKRTADGSRFRKDDFTAAHPTLPFGTVVRVTNAANGRTVKVRINDRGPRVKGRIIDLSVAAAHALAMGRRGLAYIRLKVLRADQPAGSAFRIKPARPATAMKP
jgi:rare lipoprotein A